MTAKITLKKHEERRLLSGHFWIFSNEIGTISGSPQSGDVVELAAHSGQFLGLGFFNPHSLIAFRLLSRDRESVDAEFFRKRILKAYEFRKRIYPQLDSFRAVFGESDFLPGLIVDKYGKYLAVQFLSAGLEKHREEICRALEEVIAPEGIVARNDSALRRLEGLEEKIEVISGKIPERVRIEEGESSFRADLLSGQKTGFFFDQRDNRLLLSKYCRGKTFLDCFCHSGAFGIHAARAGASHATWVDSSQPALRLAEENARLNGLDGLFNGVNADIPEYLESIKNSGKKYDIINLDPPALIKSRKDFAAGYKMYRKLNVLALEILPPGGMLATSSCSHNLGPEDFRQMLKEAAGRAGRQVWLLSLRSQAPDHPILLSMPETEYLKFALLQVI
ncbi:MAG: class I SAM-dependent rRNA methyltransferase [Endomicrobiales bacterium]